MIVITSMAELSQLLATEVDRVTSLSVAFDGNFSIDSVVTDVVLLFRVYY